MFDFKSYSAAEGWQFIRSIRRRDDAEILLFKDAAGLPFILRYYDHPVSAYQTMQSVHLPCLPQIYAYTMTEQGEALIKEEYIDGISLAEILEVAHLHWKQSAAIARQVCLALQALHERQLVHRDVKPENIFLTKEGRVVLLDLDAASNPKSEKNRDTQLLGTVGYAAPEQFGFARSDARADIFAVGVLLNVMLTGYHPSHVLAKGPLRPIIETAIQTNADQRFSSVEALLRKLPADSKPVPCPVCGMVSPGGGCIHCGTPPKRSPLPWIASGAAVLLLVGGICLFVCMDSFPRKDVPAPAPAEPISTTEQAEQTIQAPSNASLDLYIDAPYAPDILPSQDRLMVPFSYNDATYYIAPAAWEFRFGPPFPETTMRMMPDQVRYLTWGISFWTRSPEGDYFLVDEDLTQTLYHAFTSLKLEVYAASEGQIPPQKIEPDSSCYYPCAIGTRYDAQTDGTWLYSITGELDGQSFRSTMVHNWITIHPEVFEPDLTLDVSPLEQATRWLETQQPGPNVTQIISLPAGTYVGELVIPDHLQDININGDQQGNTILKGGIRSGSNCYIRNIHFIGCGKDTEQWPDGRPNAAYYGGAEGAFENCILSDYHCAIPVTEKLCFGSYGCTFRDNRTVFHFNSRLFNGGNMEMSGCLFENNDVGMEFLDISPTFAPSSLAMHDTTFRDNGVDMINHLDQKIIFPGNTFLHGTSRTPVTQTDGAEIILD